MAPSSLFGLENILTTPPHVKAELVLEVLCVKLVLRSVRPQVRRCVHPEGRKDAAVLGLCLSRIRLFIQE